MRAEGQRVAGVGRGPRPLAARHAEVRARPEDVLQVAVEVALGGECQRTLQIARDALVAAPAHHGGGGEVHQCTGGVVVLAVSRREHEGLLEQRAPALVLVAAQQRRAHVRQGVGERRAVADAAREDLGARAEVDRLGRALGEHRELRPAAQGHRQLLALGELLEHRDRPVAELDGLGAATGPPQDPREPA
jgi:hypothetical protein